MKGKRAKLRVLLSHLIITLSYPAARALTAPDHRLLRFTDAITITALVLLIGGLIYSMILHGDFDISTFVFRRGAQKEMKQDFRTYKSEQEEKRAEAFNYPLILGLFYLVLAAILAWGFL